MGGRKNIPEKTVYVCTGEKCKKRGGKDLSRLMRFYADDHHLKQVEVIRTHCTDNCKHGPVVCFQPDNEWHFEVDEPQAIALMKKYCGPG